ncbi:MAG: DNA methyltransferase [Actinomycetota bacterium]
MITNLLGPALEQIRTIPDQSIDLVATSPPFLALRNYNNLDGQWGSEATPADFLANLIDLTAEFRRVLAPHGSIAVELGDTYSGSGGSGGDYDPLGMRAGQPKTTRSAARTRVDGAGGHCNKGSGRPPRPAKGTGWPMRKSLTGVPTLYAWSLAYGRNLLDPDQTIEPWRIRNLITWARNNPPVGALGDKYRPATSYITVATTTRDRWFDLDAVRSPLTEPDRVQRRIKGSSRADGLGRPQSGIVQNADGAPPLDHWHDTEADGDLTWLVNTQGSGLAHYAMWPPKLAERLVLAMCPLEVCRTCGKPRRRLVDVAPSPVSSEQRAAGAPNGVQGPGAVGFGHRHLTRNATTTGWSDCGHDNYRPGVVLDPFAGTGTTLAVADLHGRDAIGIDLDPANQSLHAARYDEVKQSLFGVAPQLHGQMGLFA